MAALNIFRQNDGDIVIWIGMPSVPIRDGEREVEFTTIASGGGRSPHTFYALLNVIEAMKKDNEESPINRDCGDGKYVEISQTTIAED